jgi:hypothetical protein
LLPLPFLSSLFIQLVSYFRRKRFWWMKSIGTFKSVLLLPINWLRLLLCLRSTTAMWFSLIRGAAYLIINSFSTFWVHFDFECLIHIHMLSLGLMSSNSHWKKLLTKERNSKWLWLTRDQILKVSERRRRRRAVPPFILTH